jgi:hypothetical protein
MATSVLCVAGRIATPGRRGGGRTNCPSGQQLLQARRARRGRASLIVVDQFLQCAGPFQMGSPKPYEIADDRQRHALVGSAIAGRLALFNSNYRIYFSDGRTERRTLQTTEELASVLQSDFKINLPNGWEPIFDQLLQRK